MNTTRPDLLDMAIKLCSMNRHKAYWSVMGYEPSEEQTALQKRRKKHKEQLIEMINQYSGDGVFEVTKILREIIRERKEND